MIEYQALSALLLLFATIIFFIKRIRKPVRIDSQKNDIAIFINSFDSPALICGNDGKILFSNQSFIKLMSKNVTSLKDITNYMSLTSIAKGKEINYDPLAQNKTFNVLRFHHHAACPETELFIVTFKS